ncbi:MAG: RNA-binding protein [Alphaproteobacteria bacterium]
MSEAGDDTTVLAEPDTPRRRPRRCVASRTARDRDDLIRFVVGPDDRLVPDPDARLPGRGLWLSAEAESFKRAVSRNLFAKAARRRVVVDPEIAERVDRMLAERCLQWLGLARRAGLLEMGFEQVIRTARAGEIEVLVVASDAAADGREKLARAAPDRRCITLFDRAEMGAAVGREALVFAGVRPNRLATRLWNDARRLAGLRGLAAPERASKELIEQA